jgi:hypothetical protein
VLVGFLRAAAATAAAAAGAGTGTNIILHGKTKANK